METRFLFFTGKGGVGKTSLACATAIRLADEGKKVLLISTDPASNLHDVLETELGPDIRKIKNLPQLSAVNINPAAAASAYRERVINPLKGLVDEAELKKPPKNFQAPAPLRLLPLMHLPDLWMKT